MRLGEKANARRGLLAGIGALLAAIMHPGISVAQTGDSRPTLTVASFGGSLGEAIRDIFKPFEQSRGVTIRWVPGSGAENVARAAVAKGSSEFDVIMTDELSFSLGAKQGLFAPLDRAVVKNYADLVPNAQLGDGALFGFYYTGIFYRADEFAKNGWAPPTSWQDLFRPELCSRIGIAHPNTTMGLGVVVMLGGGEIGRMSDGVAQLARLKNCVPVLEPSPSKLEEKIGLGEYLISAHGQHRMIPLTQKGVPIKFVLPKEGAMLSGGVAAVAKGSRQPEFAQAFVDWITSPDAQRLVMEKALYVPANRRVTVPAHLVELGLPDATMMQRLVLPDPRVVNQERRGLIRDVERTMAR